MRTAFIAAFGALTLMSMQPANAQQTEAAPALTLMAVTIENIGRPYDVIGGACVYQQFASFTFRRDPLQNALDGAFQQMQQRARAVQADALIGYDVDFTSPMQGEEGRVLLCGTLVKFRAR